jgi:hypothetical protein
MDIAGAVVVGQGEVGQQGDSENKDVFFLHDIFHRLSS